MASGDPRHAALAPLRPPCTCGPDGQECPACRAYRLRWRGLPPADDADLPVPTRPQGRRLTLGQLRSALDATQTRLAEARQWACRNAQYEKALMRSVARYRARIRAMQALLTQEDES